MLQSQPFFLSTPRSKSHLYRYCFFVCCILFALSPLSAQNAGSITFDDFTTNRVVCLLGDNTSVFVRQNDADNVSGQNLTFVITDDNGVILAIPIGSGPFNVGPAGPGNCNIYYLAYEDGIAGLAPGSNIGDLTGSFDLSNSITTSRFAPEAGSLAFADGTTQTTLCIDDGSSTVVQAVQQEGEIVDGINSQYIITDGSGMILGSRNRTGIFDVGPAGVGNCVIYFATWSGVITGDTIGGSLDNITGCFDITNGIETIRVLCNENCDVDAGEITFTGGGTETSICLDEESTVVDVVQVNGNDVTGENFTYIITDSEGMILGTPTEGPFDLGPAGIGTCLIYYVAFGENFSGAEMGLNIDGLIGCFDLSNPVSAERNRPNAGFITFTDNTTNRVVCLDGDNTSVAVQQNEDIHGPNLTYVITDADGTILAVPEGNGPFDVGPAGPGNCQIYFLAYADGIEGLSAGNSINDLEGCFDLSNSITTVRVTNEAGSIVFSTGTTRRSVCLDGDASRIVRAIQQQGDIVTGNNSQYIITDGNGTILGSRNRTGRFNVGPAGVGNCFIYFVTWSGVITGDTTGGNIDNLVGCFDISNGIEAVRSDPEAGSIAFANGSTSRVVCLDEGANTVVQAIQQESEIVDGNNSQYIITDGNGIILGAGNNTGRFDVGPAGVGNCVIYFLTSTGVLTGVTVGNTLDDISGCFDLSNGIETVRIFCQENCEANAGSIEFTGGGTETTICLNEESAVVSVEQVDEDAVDGDDFIYIITDSNGMILGTPTEGPFDLGPAGPGTCLIYYVAIGDNFMGAEMGDNINDLEGCFDLSNSVSATRNGPNAGSITFTDFTTNRVVCLSNDNTSVVVQQNEDNDVSGPNLTYVITDADGMILAIPEGNGPFDVGSAGPGNCKIYYLAYADGIQGLRAGNNINDLEGCFDLSNSVTTSRFNNEAGSLAFSDGLTQTTICLDDGSSTVVQAVQQEGAIVTGNNSQFIITDANGMILGAGNRTGMFDVGAAGVGNCVIYFVTFSGVLTGATPGQSIDNLNGCFDISNGIETVRINCNNDVDFTASITGSQAIPCPMTTTGTGTLSASLEGNTLTVSGSFSGLASDFNANVAGGAHLHAGVAGMTGGVELRLNSELDDDLRSGIFLADSNTFELTEEQLTLLNNRGLYVNIHTVDAPSGEIRGQVLPQADAYKMASLSGIYEVPAIVTPAIGGVAIEVNGNTITVSGSFSSLEGDIATQIGGGAHIHQGISGRNGPVLFPLVMVIGDDNRSAVFPAASNSFDLTDDQMMALDMEMLYVNVHSASVMSGELRGQVADYSTAKFYSNPSGHQARPMAINTTGNGRLLIKLNDNATITVSGSINDLMGTVRTDIAGGGHLHLALAGSNGGVEFPLNMVLDTDQMGAMIMPDANTFDVTAEQIESFYARGYYANFHTTNTPSGEIRGQVMNLAKGYFGSNLSGLNSNPSAVKTTGNGFVMYELCNNQLTVTGSFAGLQSNFNALIAGGSHLHLGDANGTGPLFASLVPELAEDLRSGTYSAASNRFVLTDEQLIALQTGGVYLNIHTLENGSGEIRGQVLRDDNEFPTGPVVISPADGITVTVFEGGSDLQEGAFASATDTDSDLVVYILEATTAADTTFANPIGCLKVGAETSILASLNEIFAILVDNEIPVGTILDLRYRVRSLDGSVSTTGPANTITIEVVEDNGFTGGAAFNQRNVATTSSPASMKMFPNPVRNDLTVTTVGVQELEVNLEVYDQNGRRVLEIRNVIANDQVIIPVAMLASGAYYLRIQTGETVLTERFVKF